MAERTTAERNVRAVGIWFFIIGGFNLAVGLLIVTTDNEAAPEAMIVATTGILMLALAYNLVQCKPWAAAVAQILVVIMLIIAPVVRFFISLDADPTGSPAQLLYIIPILFGVAFAYALSGELPGKIPPGAAGSGDAGSH